MTIIRIIARRAGHRRAGIAHPAEWVEHPAGRFSSEELGALLADPMLVAEAIETPAETDARDGGDARQETPAAASRPGKAGRAGA